MRKKLLLYSDCYVFGGAEVVLLNLIDSPSVQEKFDVHFAYAMNRDYQAGVDEKLRSFHRKYPLRVLGNANLFHRIDRCGMNRYLAVAVKIPFHMFDLIGIYAIYNYMRLFLFFRKMKPDLLHINNGGYPAAASCLVAVFSARLAGIRSIVFHVNNLARSQRYLLQKWVDSYINKNVDYFVTASQLARLKLIENRKFRADKVIRIFNGIAEEKEQRSRRDILREFGVPTGKFIIVCVALLTERKGQFFLLDALDVIRERQVAIFDNIVLFLVGEGEDRRRIEQSLKERRLQDNVILTGYRKDYRDFINSADLFILPSVKDEDMPLVILSAMSLGKAIVSTRVAGIPEQIRDGKDGVLLDPPELDRLDRTIVELYSHAELRGRYGASARARFDELFSLENIVSKYIRMYEDLIGRDAPK